MRIAVLSDRAGPPPAIAPSGWQGRCLDAGFLCDLLRERLDEVRLLPLAPPRSLSAAPALWPPDALPRARSVADLLVRAWSSWRPDAVLCLTGIGGLAVLAARAAYPVPFVTAFRAIPELDRRAPSRGEGHSGAGLHAVAGDRRHQLRRLGMARLLGLQADAVLVRTRAELAQLAAMGVPRSRTHLVPPVFWSLAFRPTGDRVPRGRTRHRIISVGRLDHQAGHAAAIQVSASVPDCELMIVGGPQAPQVDADPHAAGLRRLAGELGVADRVHLVGAIEAAAMPGWYRSADLYVCARRDDSLGAAVVEAMACGLPVVGYAAGGLPDAVLDGVTGDLVPDGDHRQLGHAVRGLLREPFRCLQYGAAAADRAAHCYRPGPIADRIVDLLASIRLAGGGPATAAGVREDKPGRRSEM